MLDQHAAASAAFSEGDMHVTSSPGEAGVGDASAASILAGARQVLASDGPPPPPATASAGAATAASRAAAAAAAAPTVGPPSIRPPCAFFLKTGTCAFGDRCKFSHPYERVQPITFNSLGLPMRPGKQQSSSGGAGHEGVGRFLERFSCSLGEIVPRRGER